MDPGKEAAMSTACQVRVTGPLARYADGFRADLAAQGYAAESADRNLRTLAHVSRWMADRGLSTGQLSIARLEEFLRARRQEGYHHALSIRAVMPLVGYLRRAGVAAVPPEPAADGILKVVADQYCGYLVSERAVTTPVAGKYGGLAREFLAACAQPGGPGLAGLAAAWVTGYVVAQCRDRSPGSAKFVVTALRSLLRYLFLAGHTRCQLASAVPAVAHWGAGSLPRALSPQMVAALLASCDTASLAGRRDRAILVLLARLGPARGRGGRPGARRPGLASRGDVGSRQGRCLAYGALPLVPLVYRLISLAGPGPSGSARPSRLCQRCFPPSPASPGSDCAQLPSSCCDSLTRRSRTSFDSQRLTAHQRPVAHRPPARTGHPRGG